MNETTYDQRHELNLAAHLRALRSRWRSGNLTRDEYRDMQRRASDQLCNLLWANGVAEPGEATRAWFAAHVD
jgi:methionine synthase II (cobalamin-independent)